jgi:hypothetical protein
MLIPTYTQVLGDEQLGSSISIVHGGGIFNDVSGDDDQGLSIAEMNKQLKNSSDSIEFLPASSMEDEPFEVFKKNSQHTAKVG